MKCPRCQQENPPQAKFCLECATPLRLPPDSSDEALNVAQHLGQALRREQEAREQQAATSDILRVISNSPNDAQPVFDVIVASAVRLCDAQFGLLYRWDGENLYGVASHGATPAMEEIFRRGARPAPSLLRSHGPWRPLHILDIRESEPYRSGWAVWREAIDAETVRTILVVPLVKSDRYLGCIMIYRREVRAFTERQNELLQTFADQAVIAIENVRLFTELQASNRGLTTALDKQTATSEILRVISQSPTDVQPVFDTIVQSAARLCHAASAGVFLTDGRTLDLPANCGSSSAEALAAIRAHYPRPLDAATTAGVAILTRSVIHVPDIEASSAAEVYTRRVGRLLGVRSMIAVPMLRKGEVVGAINLSRREPGRFSDGEVELLKTFADQAVIAIENVRLFTELQASNHELTAALDKQTATAEILGVISRSQTDVQPVFDAILTSAVRLLRGYSGTLAQIAGDQIELAAYTSTGAAGDAVARDAYHRPLDSEGVHARTIRDRAPMIVANLQTDPRFPERVHAFARARGLLGVITVPLLRHGEALGSIAVAGREPGEFNTDELSLLQTFADQAVIAIENVRLFTELQEKNQALTQAHAQVSESLERQTATADVLRIIAQSPTDVQPVLDAIAASALRLCGAGDVVIERLEGDRFYNAAHAGTQTKGLLGLGLPLTRGFPGGRAILDRKRIVHHDIQLIAASEYPDVLPFLKLNPVRSFAEIPLLSDGKPLGNITVLRVEVRPFTEAEIALLQTFADQAVIAIENVRLFKELERRNRDLTRALDQQTATSDILRVISTSPAEVQSVFEAIARNSVRLCNGVLGAVFRFDGELMHIGALHGYSPEGEEATRRTFPRPPERRMLAGRAVLSRAIVHVPDVLADPEFEYRALAATADWRSLLVIPMLRGGEVLGTVGVAKAGIGPFADQEIALLQTFADQAVIAIENVRLFKELESANRELMAASQHKSEFLANMSHELRTPLNAVIGFSEVLNERMFGELNEKQADYLKDIHASGQHLLSLINDILDLSKIEAGKMDLELSDFDLSLTIDNALVLVRERAGRRNIELQRAVDERLGQVYADERKLRQVLLNLLSNAIKFTPEGGRIGVRAVQVDGIVEVSVSDTGMGIAPEDQEAIFEEFKQVGTASKKVEGTGLGLALSRKFIELHGGKIWVKSQVGQGSTFTFAIPVPRGE